MEFRNPITARRKIRQFSRELAGRCGKDARFLERDIIAAKRLNHISLDEYEWVGYYDMTTDQKKTVSTLWTRAELRKKFTHRLYKGVLMNKYIFSKVFSDYYGRKCLSTEGMTREQFDELVGDGEKIVYKPLNKGQGLGVRIISVKDEAERTAAYEKLLTMKPGIIEEFILQHPELNRLNPNAVSIVRFYSVCTPAGAYVFSPVLTTSITKNISNGCQDALTALIDIRTGEVITDAVDQINIADHAVHPATGVPFKGFMIPYWDECVAMMKKVVPEAYYISNIGWDVAITENGPLIIEANTIPGFNTAQYRGYKSVTNGYMYQPIFDEAMKGVPFTDFANYEKVLIKIR